MKQKPKHSHSGIFTRETEHQAKGIKKFLFRYYTMYEQILKYIKGNEKIFDFGCGICEPFDRLKNDYPNNSFILQGYDIDEECLKIAGKKGYKVFNDLKNIEKDYDIVTLFGVIEHLTREEAIECFEMASRILKKDGILMIGTLNPNELFNAIAIWNEAEHIKPYSIKALTKLGKINGFKVDKIYKQALRINPFKFLIDLLTADIYCGFTIILKKDEKSSLTLPINK